MKHSFCAEYKNCRIRPVHYEDIELFRIWRNNEALSRYLTPVGEITREMQDEWYRKNQKDENIVTFAVDETENFNRMIGSASLYNFSEGQAEIGKTIIGDDQARGKSLGFYSELMAVYIGFQKLNLERIIARIHEDNVASIKRSKRLGYIVTGQHPFISGGNELELTTTKAHFQEVHPYLSEIKIFDEQVCI